MKKGDKDKRSKKRRRKARKRRKRGRRKISKKKWERISAGLYFSSQNKIQKEMEECLQSYEGVYDPRILNVAKLFFMCERNKVMSKNSRAKNIFIFYV